MADMSLISRQIEKVILPAVLVLAVGLPLAPLNCLLCSTCRASATQPSEQPASPEQTPAEPPCCGHCKPPVSEHASKGCCAVPADSRSHHEPCGCCASDTSPADRAQLVIHSSPNFTGWLFALPPETALDLATNLQRRYESAAWQAALAPPIPHQVLHCSWLK